MATKVLNATQQRTKFLKCLENNGGEATAAEMVALTQFDKSTINTIAKALVKEGTIIPAPGGKIALPPEEEEAPKKVKAPAAKTPAKKGKVAPPVEEEEEDDDDEFELDEDEDTDEDDETGEEDDDDEGLDEDEEGFDDEDEDEEEVAPPVKPAKGGKKPASPPHKEFSMAFKPIDTLTDEELIDRIDNAVAASESLHSQGHEDVAEMLMRSVAKARRQLNKRQ